jgi:secreted trypsin-like serine protease
MPADGDSGAPVLLNIQGTRQLVGLVSHKFATGQLGKIRCYLYGQIIYQVRISHYTKWIEAVMSGK